MSALPAVKSSPAHAGANSEMTNTEWPRAIRQVSFVLAVAVALAITACTDIPIGPVDHSCPHGNSCGGHR
jgi:hypothetical protein